MYLSKSGAVAIGAFLLITIAASRGQNAATYPSRAHHGDAPGGSAEQVALRTWKVMDVITARHIDPPTRQEMVLGAMRGLARSAQGAKPPYPWRRSATEISTLEQFKSLVKEQWPTHLKPGADREIQLGMIGGVLAVVPGASELMPAASLRVENQVATSRYVGIGIQYQLDMEEQMPQVVTPFRNGPAHRIGLKPGDLIVAVDGRKTKGIGLEETAAWVRGPEGTPVDIVARQPHGGKERSYHIIRGVIPIETVMGYRRSGDGWQYRTEPDGAVAYLCINGIHSSTLHELRQAEARLHAAGVRSVVLDFRFAAPGTGLHQAELTGSGIVGGGRMWRLHDNEGRVQEAKSSPECLFRDCRLAVLINEETTDPMTQALVAALQDNGRAVVVGEAPPAAENLKVQVDLPDGLGGVFLPGSRLERVGKDRQWPLKPDRLVATTPIQRATIQQWIQDKQLSELPPGTTDQPPTDPQLTQAVRLLKSAATSAEQEVSQSKAP